MEQRSSNRRLVVVEATSYELPSKATDVSAAQMVGVPQPGEAILGGKYEIERVIGVGGMGVVVAAIHRQLGHRVALKLLSHAMQIPELVDRFLREGQACARIKSDHVASVLDVGRLENGTPYLMMEYLDGIDLDDYIGAHGSMSIDDAVDFVLQACDGLAVAHSAGIVHRDLKPSNLFVTIRSDGSPHVKVLDFGISKSGKDEMTSNPKSTLTRPGTMLGSPRYMSPEQLRNASNVDHRADIWAIGIVLHELIVGEPPFVAESIPDLCGMITMQQPVRLRSLKPHAPAELEAVILKCIEKNPDHRFQNVAELANALAVVAPEGSQAIALRIAKILEVAASRTTPSPTRSGAMTPRRGRLSAPPPKALSSDPTVAAHQTSGLRPSSPSLSTTEPVPGLAISTKALPYSTSQRRSALAVVLVAVALTVGAAGFFLLKARARSAALEPFAAPTLPETKTAVAIGSERAPAAAEPVPTEKPTSTGSAPMVQIPRTSPLKATTTARPKPAGASPTAGPTAPPEPPQNEADMLNRRR